MNATRYDSAVLGAGAVGIVAALCSARKSATVLILRAPAETSDVPRIETVPAPILSLLIDYGVHPRRIGVDRLYEIQHAAWECADPEMRRGRAMAHIDKAKLESELLRLASRTPQLAIVIDPRAPSQGKLEWFGAEWSARRLIDATGRAAVTAVRRVTAPKPWVARPFWRTVPAPTEMREFRIAALPNGYVYRVGSNDVDALWVAGRGAALGASPKAIEAANLRSRGRVAPGGIALFGNLAFGPRLPGLGAVGGRILCHRRGRCSARARCAVLAGDGRGLKLGVLRGRLRVGKRCRATVAAPTFRTRQPRVVAVEAPGRVPLPGFGGVAAVRRIYRHAFA